MSDWPKNLPDQPHAGSPDDLGRQLLQAISSSVDFQPSQELPESFRLALKKNRGSDLNGAVMSQLVDAALADFWPTAADSGLRNSIAQNVTQRLFEEPELVAKLELLLSNADGNSP